MNNINFSVLISVYNKEIPRHLYRALESIFKQTYRPKEVVLIKDGLLNIGLEKVINFWSHKESRILNIFQLEKNIGLAQALNFGLQHCAYEFVARMDSDDVSMEDRFEKQLGYISRNPDVDVVGSWLSEFIDNERDIISIRKVPEKHENIVKFATFKNPCNHVTVIFRKTVVLKIGGYDSLTGFEDYLLWVKMILKGYRIANIPECLVNVRIGRDMIKRRGGWKYVINEVTLQKRLLYLGFINYVQFFRNVVIRLPVRLAPANLRQYFYSLIRKV